jgi:RHS repeat-associated protein
MTRYRSFVTNGSTSTKDDASDYEYDALDRVLEQTETHGASGTPRTTLMTYLGLGKQVTREIHHNGADGTAPLLTTKDYAYDAYGHRISMTNTPNGGSVAASTYGYDVHGSVSLLLADTGTATASYGYRPYGDADDEMTAGDFDPSDRTESAGLLDNPLNAFRYSGKRFDSGSGSIDMGARRFGPDTARFLQRDNFNGATADLGLSLDPLTQNRYALASGNPISFVEWDGHLFFADGGGGGAMSPTPSGDDTGGKILKGLGGVLYDNTVGLVESGVDFATNLDKIPGNLGLAGVALTHLDMTVAVAGDDLRAGVEVYRNLPLDEQIRFVGNAVVAGFGPKIVARGAARVSGAIGAGRAGALSPFEDLAALRASEGVPAIGDVGGLLHTRARLDVGGASFYGRNAPETVQSRPPGTTYQAMRHAEGDAFGQARAAGVRGGVGDLYVDQTPCGFCKSSFAGLARSLDLQSLRVWTQEGLYGTYDISVGKFVVGS